MFFNKSTIALACIALANLVSAGQTPACLLSVVGHSENPADLKTLCGSGSSDVMSDIADKCGNNREAALKVYASTCKAAGYTVDTSVTSTASSSSGFVTATATASGSASGTAGIVASSTATGAAGSGSGSSSSSGSSTGASGTASSDPPVGTLNAAAGLQFQGSAIAAAVFVGVAALF
ncbi:hypothetical protein PDE_06128 [Penicillium oxalicum 114-2]|uniref:Extracellular membrane protein CFEM domain-containing protein n=1 Tax=Penicillium oxalicum (strain 114-2 / CGMCC 5302) TaxID=933388 RepID=S8AXT8_PENO1|nr:hypothetical protein PDE_06128 [Penicillium oxalicum 114-2]